MKNSGPGSRWLMAFSVDAKPVFRPARPSSG
jgi:hypothetical protein